MIKKRVMAIDNLSNLIKDIADGDKNALAELYEIMNKDIYIFLLMFCKDKYTAEDILHDTFIAIYENAGSYRIFNNPRAWILTIAKNKALNMIKKNSHTASIENTETEDPYIFENVIFDKMRLEALFSVISDEDKKIVVLHAVYGFKHREIAELLNMPLGTVKWRYKQSIDKMKQKDSEEVFPELNKQNEVMIVE